MVLGRTWGEPLLLRHNENGQDRNWIVRDPGSGTLYVVWQNLEAPDEGIDARTVEVAWSADGGATWRTQDAADLAPCHRAGMPAVVQGTLRFACVASDGTAGTVVQVHRFDPVTAQVALVAQMDSEGPGDFLFPFLTPLADGTLAMHYNNNVESILLRSVDAGRTWNRIGNAMEFIEGTWENAHVYWSQADRAGNQHLLVRAKRVEPTLPADPTGELLTPATFELRHVVLDAFSVAIQNSVLATWHSDSARQILGQEDDHSNNQHPRCGGTSCYYGLAWRGDTALAAFSHGGTVELAALRCVAACMPVAARVLDETTLTAVYVPPAPQPGLDEPVAYEFTGHLVLPYYFLDPHPAVEDAVRDQASATFEFDVPAGTRFVEGTLQWTTAGPTPETSDLDLLLYDAEGDTYDVGTLERPETFRFEIREGDQGAWRAIVTNYQNPPTDFTLEVRLE